MGQQDEHRILLSDALAWGCRQIACGHKKCVAAEKVRRCRGKRQVVSSPFPNVPLRFSSSRQILIALSLKVPSARKGEISAVGEEKRMPRKYT